MTETGAPYSTRASEAFEQLSKGGQNPLDHCLWATSRQLLGVLQSTAENMGGSRRHGSQIVSLYDYSQVS